MDRQDFQKFKKTPCTALEILYQCYESRATNENDVIRHYFREMEEYMKELPYEIRDRICSATSELCAEYERLAFLDGVSIGAQLILELQGL